MTTTPNKKSEPARKIDFEKSIRRLEEIVQKLETSDISLDDAMKLFEEGMKLSAECQQALAETEGRIEILMKRAAGKIAAEPFEAPEEETN